MNAKKVSPQFSCVRQLKTLADSTRLAILGLLESGPKHVYEMNAVLRLEQSLLSHHLKVLRSEGLIVAARDGKAVLYQLGSKVISVNGYRTIDLGCCFLSFDSITNKLQV